MNSDTLSVGFPENFPIDCYLEVFRFLSPEELTGTVSRVSKLWNALAQREELWKNFSVRDYPSFKRIPQLSWKQYYQISRKWVKKNIIESHENKVIGTWGSMLAVWDVSKMAAHQMVSCGFTPTDHQGPVTCFYVNQHNNCPEVSTASIDGTIKIWQWKQNSRFVRHKETLTGHSAPISALKGNCSYLVSGSVDGEIRIWKYRLFDVSSYFLFSSIKAYEEAVTALYLNSYYQLHLLFTASESGKINLWSKTGSDFQLKQTTSGFHQGKVTSLSYNSRENLLMSSGVDKTIKIWLKKTDELHCIFVLNNQSSAVSPLYSHLGRCSFYSVTDGGSIVKWERDNDGDPENIVWLKKIIITPEESHPIQSLVHRSHYHHGKLNEIYTSTAAGIKSISMGKNRGISQSVFSRSKTTFNPEPNTEVTYETESKAIKVEEASGNIPKQFQG